MKETCIYAPCYLNGNVPQGGTWIERYQKFLKYYRALKTELGFSHFVFTDNCSDIENIQKLDPELKPCGGGAKFLWTAPDITLFRFENYLERKGNHYPNGWRHQYAAPNFFSRFDKFIFLDSDGFICSKRLADYIRNLDSGMTTFWTKRHQFPEGALVVLCKDTFPVFREYTKTGNHNERLGKVMELDLPYTHVNKTFVTDRFGETHSPQIVGMDYYGQCPNDVIVTFQHEELETVPWIRKHYAAHAGLDWENDLKKEAAKFVGRVKINGQSLETGS